MTVKKPTIKLTVDEGDLGDYTDPTVKYVPPVPKVNDMNDIDPAILSKYLELDLLEATPDSKAIDPSQLELEEKERLELDTLALEADLDEKLYEQKVREAILKPREYQYELYQKALEENVIAVLDTGSGKTLISILLLKQMALQERNARLKRPETKLAFFLVDRVPLVFQQASVIRANCDLKVEEMCGEMNVDNWSEKQWKLIFEENDVCVMTAQIFLDTLRHGFISLERVHLLIFDECHHATKKHPFNLIMREFYDRCPIENRPKIFGMTASPMHARSSVKYSVSQLESNLNACVYTATNLETLNELAKPREMTVDYRATPFYNETEITHRVREQLGSVSRYSRCFTIVGDILRALGPWCCDHMWKIMLSDLERRMTMATQGLDTDALIDEDKALRETHAIVDPIELERNPNVQNETLFSPKIAKLIVILKGALNALKNFCGIVFVERRHTALAIKTLIDALDDLSAIRCEVLIGHGTTDEGDIQMTFKEQNKVINKFRDGEINLLIATNVAEEGLDIQPCNIVIRFDFFHTLIAYIQSRGRARRKDSVYFVMVEQNNTSHKGMLKDFQRLEDEMKEYCQTLPEDRNVANKYIVGMGEVEYESDEDEDLDEDFNANAFIVTETGAMVTKQNSVPLLHRYCSTLPSDSFCVLKPIFQIQQTAGGFICKLMLPPNAPFQEMESPVCRSKEHARAIVALEACVELRKLNALDEHLLPRNLKKEILGEMAAHYDENGLMIGSRRRHGLYEKRTPAFWKRQVEEEEEIAVEDNEDLLKATIHTTEELTSDIKEGNDSSIVVKEVAVNGSVKVVDTVVGNEGKSSMPEALQPTKLDINPTQLATNGGARIDGILPGTLLNEAQTDETVGQVQENTEKGTMAEVLQKEEEELGAGPFKCWFTVLEVNMEDGKLGGIPYRRVCLITKKPFPTLPKLKLFHKTVPFTVNVRNVETEIVFDRPRIILLSEYMKKLLLALLNKEFHCPIVEIPYYIVPMIKNCENTPFEQISADEFTSLIDWQEVDSILHSQNEAFSLNSGKDPLDSIVIDRTDMFRRYYVTSVRSDLSCFSPVPEDCHEKTREKGYATFADYYKEKELLKEGQEFDTSQPMLELKRVRKMMNFLYPGQIEQGQMKGQIKAWTLPSFCDRFFISASVYQAIMMIPSIMTRIDSLLLIRQARERYDLKIDDENMLSAYTTPSASMEMNYERLETLGDSLLKFIATIRLYINFPFSNEGELHHLRIRVICNRALYRAAKRLKFYRYITSHAFNRRYWRPPGFLSSADNAEAMEQLQYHRLSDKTLADIVEASLGGAYLTGGLRAGLHTAIQLQIPFDEIKSWDDFKPAFEESRKQVPPRAEAKALRSLNIPALEEILGRQFNNKLLLVEALTHASLPNSTAPCYQRLEFLGDAILDFLVIRYLFEKYPNATPGDITDLKDSCVNNHVLGIVCIENGLHKHIIHYSGKLVHAIEEFCGSIQEAKDKGEAVGEYWREYNIPKVLSDVVESILGANFVDAGFQLEPCEALFNKWFRPLFDKHVIKGQMKVHPMKRLITWLQQNGCDGFMLRNHSTGETGPNSQKCVIFLHGKPLACGSDWNIKIARRFAAAKGYQRLMDDPTLLDRVCDCRVHLNKQNKYYDDEDDEDDGY
ncbi:dicer-2 protein [Mycotypha africana]|uniref:dicer-2 protein n=1 Tax=Mycotypha africana TaxID=64632 RepID=UPI0023006ABF|nr:dicer-2 protein [Mycotypha africana]KAI8991530.1 dicer-2 protein [Mycotypha africana]